MLDYNGVEKGGRNKFSTIHACILSCSGEYELRTAFLHLLQMEH